MPRRKETDGTTPEKARRYLEAYVSALRGEAGKPSSGQISQMKLMRAPRSDIERMEYVATAFERFLCGDAPTLDRAFGVKRLGRPRGKPSKHLQWTIDVVPMLAAKMGWGAICEKLGEDLDDSVDARELRRIVKRHWTDAMEWYAARIK